MGHTQESTTTAEKLVEVAGEIFAQKGIGATVREICAAAGCSVAAINYHFGDKQRLYLRCVRLACEQKEHLFPLPVVAGVPEGMSADAVQARHELLRQFLQALMKRVAAESQFSWQDTLAWREFIKPTPEVEQEMSQARHRDFDNLNRLLSAMLGDADQRELRDALVTQIMAQTMFFKVGRSMRRILGIQSSRTEDPACVADDICDAVLCRIEATVRGSHAGEMPHIDEQTTSN